VTRCRRPRKPHRLWAAGSEGGASKARGGGDDDEEGGGRQRKTALQLGEA
jgi:hypothetical protein